MATTKNLCAQIPIDLHERVSEERERLGQTTSEYITNLIQDYYNMMENQKGGIQMTEKSRTMAFQIPEELFQRIKRHLERETLRTGKKLTQDRPVKLYVIDYQDFIFLPLQACLPPFAVTYVTACKQL